VKLFCFWRSCYWIFVIAPTALKRDSIVSADILVVMNTILDE
jgi:hypothetical protein